GLVAGAFELLPLVLVQTPPLLGYVRGRGQVQFQGRRPQDVQDLSADQSIQPLARQTLTEWLAVVDAPPDATVAQSPPRVGVADQQVAAAAGADEQAAQQRRAMAYALLGGGAVGLQTPLVGPEALGRDVGWAAAFEQDQALLRRTHGPSRSRTAAHLAPGIARPVAPAV